MFDSPSLKPHPVATAAAQPPLPDLELVPHQQDQRQPWHARNENTAYFTSGFDVHYQRPLLPGPKATIVFVVVIDIVFNPYSTKQSDHDSDANAEVERVF